jgi:hypothetical protein
MKKIFFSFFILSLLITVSCGRTSSEHDGHNHDHGDGATGDDENAALYDNVMKVHDEVMPKMNDIEKLKEELRNRIVNSPDLVEEKKREIETMIARLDSAGEGMMIWMRKFDPPADSLGAEAMQDYLKSEMEKIKKVREDILVALEEAKSQE